VNTLAPITVIMPLHDQRQFLLRAVKSVLNQTWRNLELVVVDDGSADGGADLLRPVDDPRLRCLRTECRGPGAARNTGARESESRWLAFLDADDEWEPTFLEKAADAMVRAPDTVLVYCDVRARGAAARRRDIGSGVIADYFGARMRHGVAVSSSSNLLRRDAFVASGGFPETYRYAEDIETWLRLACRGPFYFLSEPLSIIEVADRARITRRAGALQRAHGLRQLHESFLRLLATGAIPEPQVSGCRRFMQQQRGLEAMHLASAGRRRDALRALRDVPFGAHTWRAYARCLRQMLLPSGVGS